MGARRIMTCWLGIAGWLLLSVAVSMAGDVELSNRNTLELDAAAIDVAVSADGNRIFVLNDQGQLVIYSSTGKVEATIDVGRHVDQIAVGAKGDVLTLNSRQNKTVELVALETINPIDVAGSPFKGSPNAPVVVAVFSDFQ